MSLADDIAAINAAIAGPERQVTIGGQTITYRSIADLLLARDSLQALLDAEAVVTPRPRQVRAYYGGRGYSNPNE